MELSEIGNYTSTLEASLVKARLEVHGIQSGGRADTAAGTFPTLASTRGVRVLVRETDRAEALEILERMLPAGDEYPED